jgi:hypothetical protein
VENGEKGNMERFGRDNHAGTMRCSDAVIFNTRI